MRKMKALTSYRTVSIKQPGLISFPKISTKSTKMLLQEYKNAPLKRISPHFSRDPTFYGISWLHVYQSNALSPNVEC